MGPLQSAWFSTSLARARGLIGSRPGRIAVGVVSSLLAAALLAVAIHHFVTAGWPLAGGNPFVLAAVGLLFLLAYGLKAYGWRRLSRAGERPGTLSLAAASGGARRQHRSRSRSCSSVPVPPRRRFRLAPQAPQRR